MPDAARRNRPLLLGHRGTRERRSIPENTVAAFDQALADGCDGFEFDVRMTADGVAVICHDAYVEGLEVASTSAHRFPRLLRFEELLTRYRGRAFLDIELKVEGLERQTAGLLGQHPPACGFVVSSFLPQVLRMLRDHGPQLPLGVICETRDESRAWRELSVEYVIVDHRLADPELLSQLQVARKKILVWTVNDPAEMLRFRESGVEGLISDDTDLLCRTLAR
jgi:glycerophosphoryl diester phosphodiesterase